MNLNNKIAALWMPLRLTKLKVSDEGYPVPWFVQWIDGKPDFRVIDTDKFRIAIRQKRCWMCGDLLGVHQTFVLGPMCAVTRTTSEPPCHHECAEFAVLACPFLTQPRMRRNEKDMPANAMEMAGVGIKRNPGVSVLWTCKTYSTFKVGDIAGAGKGVLITVGDPEQVEFYSEGRPATRAEVVASIDSGMPLLREECKKDRDVVGSLKMLNDMHARVLALIPQEAA